MLTRIRASVRLAVFVLLVFGLKIGTAAACASHDYADLGLGSGGDHALVVKAIPDTDGFGDARMPLSHAGACAHCSCHHAAALTTTTTGLFANAPQALDVTVSGLPPSVSLNFELRPPIA
ncbi:MAG: hypothetical protein ACREPE_15645 [Lysobacter sp.]